MDFFAYVTDRPTGCSWNLSSGRAQELSAAVAGSLGARNSDRVRFPTFTWRAGELHLRIKPWQIVIGEWGRLKDVPGAPRSPHFCRRSVLSTTRSALTQHTRSRCHPNLAS